MLVELDIFSGQPNPVWELGEQDSERLVCAVNKLVAKAQARSEIDGLGYRGFLFNIGNVQHRSYRNRIMTATHMLADPERNIELFLCERLPHRLDRLRSAIL